MGHIWYLFILILKCNQLEPLPNGLSSPRFCIFSTRFEGFLKQGYPQIILFKRIFHEINSSFYHFGVPPLMETTIWSIHFRFQALQTSLGGWSCFFGVFVFESFFSALPRAVWEQNLPNDPAQNRTYPLVNLQKTIEDGQKQLIYTQKKKMVIFHSYINV